MTEVTLGPWECFQDASYYDMWCVRQVHDRTFGEGFHLVNGEEAASLRDHLNTRPASTEPADALADADKANWLRGDWYEKWQDATENADADLMATLEALRGRVENTILAALTRTDALAAELPIDSGMSAKAVERAEWLWANLPTGRKWTGLATHEKALVCRILAVLEGKRT